MSRALLPLMVLFLMIFGCSSEPGTPCEEAVERGNDRLAMCGQRTVEYSSDPIHCNEDEERIQNCFSDCYENLPCSALEPGSEPRDECTFGCLGL